MSDIKPMTTKTTATIDGKQFRLADSVIPDDARFDAIRTALKVRGVADYVNARPPRSRNRFVQIFLMLDGTAARADSRVLQAVFLEARSSGLGK